MQKFTLHKGLVAPRGATLVGNPGKLTRTTGWKPSVTFAQMIRLLLEGEGIPLPEGHGAGDSSKSTCR